MTIGERIKIRRKELGISADVIAEKLNVSRSTIFRYENGGIEKMPATVLEEIAKVLMTTPAHLMGWEEEETIRESDNNYVLDKNFIAIERAAKRMNHEDRAKLRIIMENAFEKAFSEDDEDEDDYL